MKNKAKLLLNRIAIALLVCADAAVTKALEALAPAGEPTLKSIISTFDVASAQLSRFEDLQRAAAEAHEAEQKRLAALQATVSAEADRAARIQTRLANLVS